jgi:hypothetical protein
VTTTTDVGLRIRRFNGPMPLTCRRPRDHRPNGPLPAALTTYGLPPTEHIPAAANGIYSLRNDGLFGLSNNAMNQTRRWG